MIKIGQPPLTRLRPRRPISIDWGKFGSMFSAAGIAFALLAVWVVAERWAM